MAVEDELRGGAIPDIKPRILTDQVCACVYIFYHPYSLNQSCPPRTLPHSCITSEASAPRVRAAKSCTPPVLISQEHHDVDVTAFHHSLRTPQRENRPHPFFFFPFGGEGGRIASCHDPPPLKTEFIIPHYCDPSSPNPRL